MVGQDQVAERRRVVGDAREGDLERHLGQCGGETDGRGRRVRGVRVAHDEQRHIAGRHALGELAHLSVTRDALEREIALGGEDRLPDVPTRLVQLGDGRSELPCVGTVATREDRTRARTADLRGETFDELHADTGGFGSGCHGPAPEQCIDDRDLGARPRRDPLVGVQAGERTARTHIDEARRALDLAARGGEGELLRDRQSPPVEEVGTERDDERRGTEVDLRP